MASSVSAVMRMGGRRPKTCAAAMTTSDSAQVFFIDFALFRQLFRRQFPGVALRGLAGFAEVDLEKLRAEGFHLFLNHGTRVVSDDFRAQPFRGRDGLQAGHADPDDEHLRGQNRARCRGHHGKNLAGMGRGQNDGHVAGQVGLRGERIHPLAQGGAGNHLHRDGADSWRRPVAAEGGFVEGIEMTDMDAARLQGLDLASSPACPDAGRCRQRQAGV